MQWVMFIIMLKRILEKVNWFIQDLWKYGEQANPMRISENSVRDSL